MSVQTQHTIQLRNDGGILTVIVSKDSDKLQVRLEENGGLFTVTKEEWWCVSGRGWKANWGRYHTYR